MKEMWLIGTFFQCEKKVRLTALYEVLFGIIIGTVPFWIGGLVLFVTNESFTGGSAQEWLETYLSAVFSTIQKGELLVFTITFIAPTLWLSSHEPDGAKTLPHRRPIVALTLLTCMVCGVLFGLIQANVKTNQNGILAISIAATIGAFLLMYLSLAYHAFRLPPIEISERDLRVNQEKLLQEVSNSRGIDNE